MKPGATALQRMPREPSSLAMEGEICVGHYKVRGDEFFPMMPAFEAA